MSLADEVLACACVPVLGVVDHAEWFALQTRYRHEKSVRDLLTRRHIDTVLPVTTRVSQWADRRKIIIEPLFPGYCFARFVRGRHGPILQAPGVVTIVGPGSRPQALSDEEVLTLERLAAGAVDCAVTPDIEEGEPVRIVYGPLAGLTGSVVRWANLCDVVLNIRLIQQGARVQLPRASIRPLS